MKDFLELLSFAILIVIFGAIVVLIAFAMFVMPFFGVFEPLIGGVLAIGLILVIIGALSFMDS